MTQMLERDVEAYLVKRVTAAGGNVRKVKWIGRRGAPDRLVYGPCLRKCFVELKRPTGGRLSKQQIEEIDDLRAGGFDVFLVTSPAEVDAFMLWAVIQ